MNLSIEGAYIYFTIPLLGGIPITQTTVSSFLATALLCLASIALGRNLKKRPGRAQVLVERAVTMLKDMVEQTMGPHNVRWTPFIGTLFFSSLFGSYMGLTGFFRSSTADISCTMVWAGMVSIIIWYNGIRHKGLWGWLKGFGEPVRVMAPMNVLSELAQPVSMGFRHFGNIAGGNVITTLLYTALSAASAALLRGIAQSGPWTSLFLLALAAGLWSRRKGRGKWVLWAAGLSGVPGFFGLLEWLGLLRGVPVLAYGIPAVLSGYFDIFSGFVQAYVFTLLTMVYIAGSLPEPEL